MAEIKLPVVGRVPRGWLFTVGGAAAAVLVYAWWRHRAAGAAGPAADPAAGGGIDPATGMPYDQGYSADYGYSAVPYGSYPGAYDPATGAYIGAGIGPSGSSPPTTNAAWAQLVEAYLASLGYNPLTVAAALGKALAGLQVTQDQAAIVETGIAFQGRPPAGMPPLNIAPPAGQNDSPSAGGWPKKVTADGHTTLGGMVQRVFPAKGGTEVRRIAGVVAHRNGMSVRDIDRVVARGRVIRIDRF